MAPCLSSASCHDTLFVGFGRRRLLTALCRAGRGPPFTKGWVMASSLADLGMASAPARSGSVETPYRSLLLLRFAVLNLVGFALLAAVWLQGWLDPLLEADSLTHMCKLIFVVFLVGLWRAFREVRRLSFELNQLASYPAGSPSRVRDFMAATSGSDAAGRATLGAAMRLRLMQKIAPVRHTASRLVLLGIIGTILGFIIALYSGVDPSAASDLDAVGPMVAGVLQGIGIAFFKTLTGSVLNLWLMANHRLLEEGTVHFVTHLIELAEGRHAGA